MKLYWNFQRGGDEVLENILSVGEVWIFSGTTHYFSVRANVASYADALWACHVMLRKIE